MIFKSYSSGNHNAFMFNRIDTTISMLSDAFLLLKRHAQHHNNYSIKRATNTLFKMIVDLNDNIEIQKRDLNLSNIYSKESISIVDNKVAESA